MNTTKMLAMTAGFALAMASANAQITGDSITAKLAGHEWVTVKNLDPVRSANVTFGFGDTCSVNRPGEVNIVSKLPDDDLLVRYYTPAQTGGALCPSGTLFRMKRDDFLSSTDRFNAVVAQETAERDLIKQALGKGP